MHVISNQLLLSDIQKSMAEIEVRVTENVMEACTRTPSIKRCVFTSSLSACVWQDNTQSDLSPVINHGSWSSESLCIDKKVNLHNNCVFLPLIYYIFIQVICYMTLLFLLNIWQLWYALGKMRAENAAWRIANERGLKLTTICPALITGPEFCRRNPTGTIAYLKGTK